MALLAHSVGIHRKSVVVGGLMILVLRGAFLHMAADALVFEPQRVRPGRIGRRACIQFADGAEQNVVLRGMMWSATGTGPRSPAVIMALSADIDVRIILAEKRAGGGNEIIVGRERRAQKLSRVSGV